MSGDLQDRGTGRQAPGHPGRTLPSRGAQPLPEQPGNQTRGRLVWNLAFFELKLAFDGLKDLVLAPLALGALACDLMLAQERRGVFMRWVMRLGERFDAWLNLYGLSGRRSSSGILDEGGSNVIADYLETTAREIHREIKDRRDTRDPR